jgi:hypothetical protein
MIIHVSIPEALIIPDNAPMLERLVHDLVDAYIKGRHLLVVERGTIDNLRKVVSLSQQHDVVLRELFSFFSQTKSALAGAPTFLRVSDLDSEMRATGRFFSVGVKQFVNCEMHREPRLLVEHALNDGEFLSIALQRLATKARLGRLVFETGHGGGDDMPDMFLASLANNRITVCVADSDKGHPGAGSSGKCLKLKRIVRQRKDMPCYFVELPCHEVENMIPLSVLYELMPSKDAVATLDTLEAIDAAEAASGIPQNERFKLYFDMKDGFSSANSGNISRAQRSFIQERLSLAGVDIKKAEISGIGKKLAKQITDDNKFLSQFCQRIMTCPYWKDVFFESFKVLLYYLIGGQRRPAM